VINVATAVGSSTRTGRNLRAWGLAGLFMLPALALYGLFVLFPIVQAARFSLFDWNGLEALDTFIGLANSSVRWPTRSSSARSVTTPSSSSCRWPSRSRSRSALR
jgi:ABC-type sugar transport system permease subunit